MVAPSANVVGAKLMEPWPDGSVWPAMMPGSTMEKSTPDTDPFVGAYTGSGLREQNLSAAVDGRWPFGPGLALTARLERRWASSNDGYEAAHRFNHEATSILIGVAFER